MKEKIMPFKNPSFRVMGNFYRYFCENKDTDWEAILSPSLMKILNPIWVDNPRHKDPHWQLGNEIVLHIYWLILGHPTLKFDIDNLGKIIENKAEEEE